MRSASSTAFAQAQYACAVRKFIEELLHAVAPEIAGSPGLLDAAEVFAAKINALLTGLLQRQVSDGECCHEIAEFACREMNTLCGVAWEASRRAGFGAIARQYLTPRVLISLVLSQDWKKLDALTAAVRDGDADPGRTLMLVGEVLDGRGGFYDSMGARAQHKATRDVSNIVDRIESLVTKVESLNAQTAKPPRSRRGRKRGWKYSDAAREACLAVWAMAKEDAAVRDSVNTRVTYKAVFTRYRRELAEYGVDSVEKFRAIIHAAQNLECDKRKRKLEARQVQAPKNANTKARKYDIICAMKHHLTAALALTLAIVSGMAANMRCDASVKVEKTPPIPENRACSVAVSRPDSAAVLGRATARAELRGRVVKVADGDTLTILGPDNTQYKIRLNGIDAPEKSQAFGQKSKERLSSLVFNRDVVVKWKSKDKYGRILGVVYLGTVDINLAMLRDGMAWHYKRFDSNPAYAAAESDARQNRRGLWADKNPIEPEKFRHPDTSATKITIPRSPGPSEPVGSRVPRDREEYFAGSAMPVGSRKAAPVCDKWPDTGFWLSTNSNKRHNRKCENYRKTRGYPCSSSDGTPCGKCGG